MAFRERLDAVKSYMHEKDISLLLQRKIVRHIGLLFEKYQWVKANI